MEFITRSKRSNVECSIDVYFERVNGIPQYINDKTTWKMLLLDRGSFIIGHKQRMLDFTRFFIDSLFVVKTFRKRGCRVRPSLERRRN